jgi:hypothetical protein
MYAVVRKSIHIFISAVHFHFLRSVYHAPCTSDAPRCSDFVSVRNSRPCVCVICPFIYYHYNTILTCIPTKLNSVLITNESYCTKISFNTILFLEGEACKFGYFRKTEIWTDRQNPGCNGRERAEGRTVDG